MGPFESHFPNLIGGPPTLEESPHKDSFIISRRPPSPCSCGPTLPLTWSAWDAWGTAGTIAGIVSLKPLSTCVRNNNHSYQHPIIHSSSRAGRDNNGETSWSIIQKISTHLSLSSPQITKEGLTTLPHKETGNWQTQAGRYKINTKDETIFAYKQSISGGEGRNLICTLDAYVAAASFAFHIKDGGRSPCLYFVKTNFINISCDKAYVYGRKRLINSGSVFVLTLIIISSRFTLIS